QFAGDWNAISVPDEALAGMSGKGRAETTHAKPLWHGSLVVLAGPQTTLLFAVAIFAAFDLAFGKVGATSEIARFTEGSAAQEAGLKVGDRIVAVDGNAVSSFTEIPQYVVPYPGRTVTIAAERDGRTVEIPVRIAEQVE